MVDIYTQPGVGFGVDAKTRALNELHEALESDIHAPLYSERAENGYRPVFGEGKPTAQIGKTLQVLAALGCALDITPPPDTKGARKA